MILQGESGGVGTETIEELPEEENLQKMIAKLRKLL